MTEPVFSKILLIFGRKICLTGVTNLNLAQLSLDLFPLYLSIWFVSKHQAGVRYLQSGKKSVQSYHLKLGRLRTVHAFDHSYYVRESTNQIQNFIEFDPLIEEL